MFSRCSVVVPHVDVFLMYLLGEVDLHILLLHHHEGPPAPKMNFAFLPLSYSWSLNRLYECIFKNYKWSSQNSIKITS